MLKNWKKMRLLLVITFGFLLIFAAPASAHHYNNIWYWGTPQTSYEYHYEMFDANVHRTVVVATKTQTAYNRWHQPIRTDTLETKVIRDEHESHNIDWNNGRCGICGFQIYNWHYNHWDRFDQRCGYWNQYRGWNYGPPYPGY